MRKRIAKKINNDPYRYTDKQCRKAFRRVGHSLVAGKKHTYNINDLLNIEGLQSSCKHLNGQFTITSVDKDGFTISSI
jgi:hypothetical protein